MGGFTPHHCYKGEHGSVVYKSIAVIGLGTLGGFVANAVANLESLESLILIDHDTVEAKNLKNSIYRQIDIGSKKTESLCEIIKHKNADLTIIALNEEYIEGKTEIPGCDLVLDCRDYTYDRRKEIDVRLYISSRYLMVDCRKKAQYKIKTEGKYLIELTKEDLRYAGSLASMLIHNNTIEKLIKDHSVQKYELDYVKHIETRECDILYEGMEGEDRFLNLPENILPILKQNKVAALDVCVGSVLQPLVQSSIPQHALKTSDDLITSLNQIISRECNFNNFIIVLHQTEGRSLIELVPETGAA